ncbi:Gram-negative bacteria-binding protein 1 [Pyrenophora tritici-repentis]|nr:Gram-negative bacteria-binding protein 1 [Pyrenophora tritici-repentis]
MPSFFKRNKKAPEEAPPTTAHSQDVPDLPAGMSQRRPDTASMPYVPRTPSNLAFAGPVYQNQIGAADLRKQPRPFKSYRLRGEYVLHRMNYMISQN